MLIVIKEGISKVINFFCMPGRYLGALGKKICTNISEKNSRSSLLIMDTVTPFEEKLTDSILIESGTVCVIICDFHIFEKVIFDESIMTFYYCNLFLIQL